MKAEIVVTRTYRFEIDPWEYDPDITSWQQALDFDADDGGYEDFDSDFEITARLLGDSHEPWPSADDREGE